MVIVRMYPATLSRSLPSKVRYQWRSPRWTRDAAKCIHVCEECNDFRIAPLANILNKHDGRAERVKTCLRASGSVGRPVGRSVPIERWVTMRLTCFVTKVEKWRERSERATSWDGVSQFCLNVTHGASDIRGRSAASRKRVCPRCKGGRRCRTARWRSRSSRSSSGCTRSRGRRCRTASRSARSGWAGLGRGDTDVF